MRGRTWGIWCVVAIALVTFGGNNSPGEDKPAIAAAKSLSPEDRIREVLAKPVTLEYVQVPLKMFVEQLEKTSGIHIRIDAQALKDNDLNAFACVHADLKDISLRNGLKWFLRPLKMTYLIEHGGITITTLDVYEKQLHTRLYSVDDLAQDRNEYGEDFLNTPGLLDLLQSNVRPETWDVVGRPGTVDALNRLLVIHQTEIVHEEIASLFAALRVAKARPKNEPVRGSILASGTPTEQAAQLRFTKQLEQKIDVDFDKVPLDKAIDILKTKTGIPFAFDEINIELDNIDLSLPVSLKQQQIAGRDALSLILRSHKLSFVVKQELPLIVPRSVAKMMGETRIYPCHDLLPPQQPLDRVFEDQCEKLAEVIQQTCQSSDWDEVGGAGSVHSFGSPELLIATTTAENHENIQKLLAEMRLKQGEVPIQPPKYDPFSSEKTTRVFRLFERTPFRQDGLKAEDVAEIVKATMGETAWKEEGTFIRVAKNNPIVTTTKGRDGVETIETKAQPSRTLIIRQGPKAMYEACRILDRLGVWKSSRGLKIDGGTGGGLSGKDLERLKKYGFGDAGPGRFEGGGPF